MTIVLAFCVLGLGVAAIMQGIEFSTRYEAVVDASREMDLAVTALEDTVVKLEQELIAAQGAIRGLASQLQRITIEREVLDAR